MTFEHFALNVPDARAHAQWYVTHAGFRLLRQAPESPFTTFLADDTGRVVVELYSNPKATCHDFNAHHPLLFHFALVTRDTAGDRARFERAGARFFIEDTLPDGTKLTMLRDPWGVPLQLCERTKPFVIG
jgi:glyoxylase I family protein